MDLLPAGRCQIMGIINSTADSFSGDGLLQAADWVDQALQQAKDFVAAGADIIDVGGESTRPGAQLVSAADEIAQVVPVIAAIRAAFPDLPIAIDSYKAATAKAAIAAGATIINDVWAGLADPAILALAAETGLPYIGMHNRADGRNLQRDAVAGLSYSPPAYQHFWPEFMAELAAMMARLKQAGLRDEQLIIDPGIGFGKTVTQNLQIIAGTGQIRALGWPVLIGASRKSFIGHVLDLPVEQRLEGTIAASVVSAINGASIVRVHDVQAVSRAIRMAAAIQAAASL